MPCIVPRPIIYLAVLATAACATFQPDFETPTITLASIRSLPSESLTPRFEIGLHIVNPNRSALKLDGIAYNLKLAGHKILTGVANDLPVIEAYGEGDIRLIATTSLMNGIRLLADLMDSQPDTIAYELDAKLDLGKLRPPVHVGEKGKINLTGRNDN
jgi:LEA14-like dessication related protein